MAQWKIYIYFWNESELNVCFKMIIIQRKETTSDNGPSERSLFIRCFLSNKQSLLSNFIYKQINNISGKESSSRFARLVTHFNEIAKQHMQYFIELKMMLSQHRHCMCICRCSRASHSCFADKESSDSIFDLLHISCIERFSGLSTSQKHIFIPLYLFINNIDNIHSLCAFVRHRITPTSI